MIICLRFIQNLMGISCFRLFYAKHNKPSFQKGVSNEKEHAYFILPITTHFSSLFRQVFRHPFSNPAARLFH